MFQKLIQLLLAFLIIKDHAIQKLLNFKLFSVFKKNKFGYHFFVFFPTTLRFTSPFRLISTGSFTYHLFPSSDCNVQIRQSIQHYRMTVIVLFYLVS